MTVDQIAVFTVLGAALILFAWERWRFDIVAMASLMALVVMGMVPAERAFMGFGHTATITVAAILVMSRGFANSGAVDILARPIMAAMRSPALHVGALCAMAATLSAFMNNVAALALLMPVAIQSSTKAGRSPSLVLMPLAFAAVLGGIVTLVGTPPNIILSGFRQQSLGQPFHLLDFAPVGLPVAVLGTMFLALIGWRLLGSAARRTTPSGLELVREYLAELRIPEGGEVAGMSLAEVDKRITGLDVLILGIVRGGRRLPPDRRWLVLRAGDTLLVEAAPAVLERLMDAIDARLVTADEEELAEAREADGGVSRPVIAEDSLMEVVVGPRSGIRGQSARKLALAQRFSVNLLAVSRHGRSHRTRLSEFRVASGDLLLLQGDRNRLLEAVQALDCLPLAGRDHALGMRRRPVLGILTFAGPILLAATGFLPLPVALVCGALLVVLLGLVPMRELYSAIDWPVVVLLGAMLPVGEAFATTGATVLVADLVVQLAGGLAPYFTIACVILATMLLSNLLNNAATAVIMGPIALAIASALGRSPDVFLMAVAIGASCAFLTPVGHQNYMLVMGPGGYRFRDYWRIGLPLELLIVALATPLLLLVWGKA